MLRKDLQKRRYPEDGVPRAQSSSPPSPRRQTLSLPASVGSDTPQLGAPGTTNPPQLKTDMLCWGSNSNGQLGVGDYLSRVYPGNARVDSSNYSPAPFWSVGVQMAALNFQTPHTAPLQLNTGFFRLNG